MDERVFTILCHGTSSSSKDRLLAGEIVTVFGNQFRQDTRKTEYQDYLILEGAGSQGDPDLIQMKEVNGQMVEGAKYARLDVDSWINDDKWYNRAAGYYGIFLRDIADELGVAKGFVGKDKVFNSGLRRIINQIGGVGVAQNVVNAMKVIRWNCKYGRKPDKINMMGWSRGAVTCIRIAYALSQDNNLNTIPVNIFAVDPVAGNNAYKDVGAKTINDNVKNFVSTLARGEIRSQFTPTDHRVIENYSDKTMLILPLKGIHDDTAYWTNPAGVITFNLCYRFLDKLGSKVPKSLSMFKMSNKGMLTQYDKLRKDPKYLHKADQYRKKTPWTKFYQGFSTPRGGRAKIKSGDITSDAGFFMNPHHRYLLKKMAPTVFDAYFGAGKGMRNSPQWHRLWINRIWNDPSSKNITQQDMEQLRNLSGRVSPEAPLTRLEIMDRCGLVDP